MSRKSARDILTEREENYREMARLAEQSAATSQDAYTRTVYFSLAEGWLGFANQIAMELGPDATATKERPVKPHKAHMSVGGVA